MNHQDLFETLSRLLELPREAATAQFKLNLENPSEIGQYLSALANAAPLAIHEQDSLPLVLKNHIVISRSLARACVCHFRGRRPPHEKETIQAAALCQRSEAQMRNTLSQMERDRAYFERGGTGRGAYWVLSAKLNQRLRPGSRDETQRRIDWEGAKTRVLSILKQRAERGEGGITNKEIRAITHYDRNQSYRLMKELRSENLRIKSESHGKGARYVWE